MVCPVENDSEAVSRAPIKEHSISNTCRDVGKSCDNKTS